MTGTVRFLKGQNLSRDLEGDPVFKANQAAGDSEGVARAFLAHFGDLWGLDDPATELALQSVLVDRSGASHVRFAQQWRGLPVTGAQLFVHLDRERRVVLVNGTYVKSPSGVDLEPGLDADAARAAAAKETGGAPCTACAADLVIFAERGKWARLAWRIGPAPGGLRGEEITVDANDGAVLRRIPAALPKARGISGGTK